MQNKELATKLKDYVEKLKVENVSLRDQLAISLNVNFFYENKLRIEEAKNDKVEPTVVVQTNSNIQRVEELEQQLAEIQSSNMYKIWIRYCTLPKFYHWVVRAFLSPAKAVYKCIKGVR